MRAFVTGGTGFIGQECLNNTPRKYLTVKDCDINNINDDELWTFI